MKILRGVCSVFQVFLLFSCTETITEILEYGIKYKLDLAKIMWSPGNTGWRSVLSGPKEVAEFYTFDNPSTIIDYFAGIGYFSIQMAFQLQLISF
mgnify:CR=1 FL=1